MPGGEDERRRRTYFEDDLHLCGHRFASSVCSNVKGQYEGSERANKKLKIYVIVFNIKCVQIGGTEKISDRVKKSLFFFLSNFSNVFLLCVLG